MRPMTRRRRRAVWFVSVLIVCLMALSGCLANQLVLGENHQTINPQGAHRRLVQSGPATIECWIADSSNVPAGGPDAFVLLLTGKGARAETWTAVVAEVWGKPVEVWGMNYPGSGGSSGPARLDEVVPWTEAVFDEMTRAAGGKPVFVQAASFGTAAALGLAARRPVAGMVLQNAPPLRQLILGRYGWWNLWLLAGPVTMQLPDDLDSIANASHCHAPAVFLLGDYDQIVPIHYQRRITAAYAGPLRMIDNPARHSDPLTKEAAAQLAADRVWLWDNVHGSAAAPSLGQKLPR
jgi:uncharacterized protein